MAEEEKDPSKISSSAYMSVPASTTVETPAPASAHLTWTSGAETIGYQATASHLEVRDDKGVLEGMMFSLAYVKVDAEGSPDRTRPVTFAYNGGPGSASVAINFGGIGPRRVRTDGTNHVRMNTPVEDNPSTLLRDSDIVFLDALGTGWSSVAEGTDPTKLFGLDADADAFARAITSWLESNGRWSSPIYLFGESYGTTRNAVLMRILGERGVGLTGVVMLSAIYDWVQTLAGEDMYYLGMMPTFAAAAQFFGKAGAGVDENEWFDQAMAFTEDVYAPALLRGDRLPAEREREVADELSEFWGLSAEHILERHLRIDLTDFRQNILKDEGKICGRLDMRFCSDAPSPMQASNTWIGGEDAADDAVEGAWTNAFRSFCHDELGYRGPARYLASNWENVGHKWGWEHNELGTEDGESPIPNVALDIAVALRRNPTCKLAIIGGRYDAATTFWNVVHDLSCQYLSPELKERISWYRYGCGHMAYVDEPTLEAMGRDMHAFFEKR